MKKFLSFLFFLPLTIQAETFHAPQHVFLKITPHQNSQSHKLELTQKLKIYQYLRLQFQSKIAQRTS